jgi:hypothetical protein
MKSLFTALSVGIAALGFAVLATARFSTDPQCFLVFYQSRSGLHALVGPADWTTDMLWFFISETPFLLWFGAYCSGFLLFAWVWNRCRQGRIQTSLHQAGWLLLPMVLLLIPASFWSDIPGSGWWVHANYHDGRGDYPVLHVFKPRYIGLLTLAWVAYWSWRFSWATSS